MSTSDARIEALAAKASADGSHNGLLVASAELTIQRSIAAIVLARRRQQ
jgi:hypothetical protein